MITSGTREARARLERAGADLTYLQAAALRAAIAADDASERRGATVLEVCYAHHRATRIRLSRRAMRARLDRLARRRLVLIERPLTRGTENRYSPTPLGRLVDAALRAGHPLPAAPDSLGGRA